MALTLTRQKSAAQVTPNVMAQGDTVTNEGEVYFALNGYNFDPDEVTRRIGLIPTVVKLKADQIPKCSSWVLSSGKVKDDLLDIYEMAAKVVKPLAAKVAQIKSVKEQYDLHAVLQVVLWISADESVPTPAIGFDEDVTAFLGTIGASIDIDTYRN
jgi:hypothetical protein